MAHAVPVTEVDRVAIVGAVAADALLLEVRRHDEGDGREAHVFVECGADSDLARGLVLDVLLPRAREYAVPECAAARRRVEVDLRLLGILIQSQAALEAPRRVEDVLVAVAQLEARPGVGGVAHAGFDVLRRGFDHRHA
jgi:hypothetical protein